MSGGLLLGSRPVDSNGEPVPRGVCWGEGGSGLMVVGKVGGMAGFGGHHGRVGRKSPIYRLRRAAEVPPAGVGFIAAYHPGRRDRVSASGGHAARSIPLGPL